MAENDLLRQLESFERDSLAALEKITDEVDLTKWRVANLGKSSFVMQVFSKLGEAPKEDRPKIGQAAYQFR